jgi:hypothetical protein
LFSFIELEDVIRLQFLLARNGIGIEESNRIAFFESEAFAELCMTFEESKYGTPHLAE